MTNVTKVAKIARKLGVTLVVASSDISRFVGALQPDKVYILTENTLTTP